MGNSQGVISGKISRTIESSSIPLFVETGLEEFGVTPDGKSIPRITESMHAVHG